MVQFSFSVDERFPNARGVARWLHRNNGASCNDAARAGRVDVLRWMRSNGYTWNARTSAAAALGGHLDVLRWLHRRGCPRDEETYDIAEVGENLEMVKWLRRSRPGWPRCRIVASLGSLSVFSWLHTLECGDTCTAPYSAALYGRVDVLSWLDERGRSFTGLVCEYAAAGGQLGALKWLSLRAPWDAHVCVAACRYGHLHVLKWAVENGCRWSPAECKLAAGEFPDILRWVCANFSEGRQMLA